MPVNSTDVPVADFSANNTNESALPLPLPPLPAIAPHELVYPSSGSFSRSISYDNLESEIMDFNYRDYEYNGSITASINIDKLTNINEDDMLIAFVDGDYRGYAHPVLFPITNQYIVQLLQPELKIPA